MILLLVGFRWPVAEPCLFPVTVVWLALGVWKITGLQVVAASLKGLVVAAGPSLHYFWGYFAVAYASGERCYRVIREGFAGFL